MCWVLAMNWVEEHQGKVPPIVAKYGPVVACKGDQFEVIYGSFDGEPDGLATISI